MRQSALLPLQLEGSGSPESEACDHQYIGAVLVCLHRQLGGVPSVIGYLNTAEC